MKRIGGSGVVALILALVLPAPQPGIAAQQVTPVPDTTCRWDPGCSTPGVHLLLEEVDRSRNRGSTRVSYVMRAAGFPPGPIYTLWGYEFAEHPSPWFTGYAADSGGTVHCLKSAPPDTAQPLPTKTWCSSDLSDIDYRASLFVKGEPIRLALLSADSTIRGYATAYPFPIEAKDKTCRVWLELVTFNAFAASGEGFEPGEHVSWTSQSGAEVLEGQQTVSQRGTLPHAILSPGIKGKKGGTARYSVEGKTCRVSVEYGWGHEATQVQ